MLTHFPNPQWNRGEDRNCQSEKTHGSRKRQCNKWRQEGWSNAEATLTTSQQADAQPLIRSSPPLKFLLLSVTLYNTVYHFGQFGSADQAVSPSSFLPTHCLLSGRQTGKKNCWCHASDAQQELNHWCVIYSAPVTNPKHTTTQTMKRINSLPDRPSTSVQQRMLTYQKKYCKTWF